MVYDVLYVLSVIVNMTVWRVASMPHLMHTLARVRARARAHTHTQKMGTTSPDHTSDKTIMHTTSFNSVRYFFLGNDKHFIVYKNY